MKNRWPRSWSSVARGVLDVRGVSLTDGGSRVPSEANCTRRAKKKDSWNVHGRKVVEQKCKPTGDAISLPLVDIATQEIQRCSRLF